jgi:hypothetical protein
MSHRVAPVIAAQALLAHGVDEAAVFAYVQRTWRLDPADARAAIAAANTLAGHDHGIRVATRSDREESQVSESGRRGDGRFGPVEVGPAA